MVAAGIALAMPGVLSNMKAGLTIIFTKPNRVGENIAVLGVEGEVVVISLFNTDLAHPDRSRIVVPNRKVMGELLQNFGKLRQCEIFFWIAYESDLNRALSAVREVVTGNSLVLTDPTAVIQIC